MIRKTSGEKSGGHPRVFTHRRGQVSGDSLNKPIDKKSSHPVEVRGCFPEPWYCLHNRAREHFWSMAGRVRGCLYGILITTHDMHYPSESLTCDNTD